MSSSRVHQTPLDSRKIETKEIAMTTIRIFDPSPERKSKFSWGFLPDCAVASWINNHHCSKARAGKNQISRQL
jgi:hypothetical protein